jgi:hypothetical protein
MLKHIKHKTDVYYLCDQTFTKLGLKPGQQVIIGELKEALDYQHKLNQLITDFRRAIVTIEYHYTELKEASPSLLENELEHMPSFLMMMETEKKKTDYFDLPIIVGEIKDGVHVYPDETPSIIKNHFMVSGINDVEAVHKYTVNELGKWMKYHLKYSSRTKEALTIFFKEQMDIGGMDIESIEIFEMNKNNLSLGGDFNLN